VNLADALLAECTTLQAAVIDPALHGDMGLGFELEVAFLGVVAVILFQGALDIDRVRIMAFNQVAVVAVHGPHEIGQGGEHAFGQTTAKPGCMRGQFDCQIGQPFAVARTL